MTANPLPIGITPRNTAEFLDGRVTVTPVLFESNGVRDPQSQNWSAQEIRDMVADVTEGVNWWTRALDRMDTVHELEFVIDTTFATDPVETVYEPIDRPSADFERYVSDFLTAQGYGDSSSLEHAVHQFNHDQRIKNDTDWAFTVFIVDSSDDLDGLFEPGPLMGAFAYAGGLFIVTPSSRPPSTFAHEMGHIFWARDEYSGASSYTDRRGYYNSPVLNAADNPEQGFVQEDSIMRGGVPLGAAYQSETSPASTFALVGWRDSDGDGVFDFADVPLDLNAIGYFDTESSQLIVSGTASAVPLRNENSSGFQSDITLNRVSELQYRLDQGPWITASSPDQQVVDFDLAITISEAFSSVEIRAIDLSNGITSEPVSIGVTTPGTSTASITGYAFVDSNDNGVRDQDEPLMSGASVVVLQADGNPLPRGGYAANDFQIGEINIPTPGVTFTAEGTLMASRLGSFQSSEVGKRVFHGFNTQSDQWLDEWNDRRALVAEFDQVVGEVQLSVTGMDDGSYARIEAYDQFGNDVTRVTSDLIAAGETQFISINDPLGRIASIKAFGHADTDITIDDLRYGYTDSLMTDDSGTWKIDNLPTGNYRVDLIADNLIHRFDSSSIQLSVSGGSSDQIVAAASRVDSPRHNTLNAHDVGADGEVTSRDALLVINDIKQFGARVLSPNETGGNFVDVNNDGTVTSLDALLVINALAQQDLESEQVSAPLSADSAWDPAANDAVLSGWTPGPFAPLGGTDPAGMLKSDDGAAEDESTEGIPTDIDSVAVGNPGSHHFPFGGGSTENGANPLIAGVNHAESEESPNQRNAQNEPEKLEPLIQTEV